MEHVPSWGSAVHWFWFLPLLFMILMFLFGCRMFRRARTGRRDAGRRPGWRAFGCCNPGPVAPGHSAEDDPRVILDLRYVKGEITKEQYEQMKNDVMSGQ